jgi:hypothetical protein
MSSWTALDMIELPSEKISIVHQTINGKLGAFSHSNHNSVVDILRQEST